MQTDEGRVPVPLRGACAQRTARKIAEGITPARLPTAGQLEGFGQGQRFTAVGCGGQEAVNQPGSPVIGYLRLSQNPATGVGTCCGDSGGPNLLGAGATATGIIAGTTIIGDHFCKATNVTYRLDTASARGFPARFVAPP